MKIQMTSPRIGAFRQGTPKVLFAAILLTAGLGAHADMALYSDTTNFTGFAYTNGGAAAISGIRTTKLVADDLTFDSSAAGQSVTQFSFPVANLGTAPITARPRIRFYMDDNPAGGPGTFITGYSFTAFAIPVGVSTYFTTLPALSFVLPTVAPGATSETIWAGITYDNSGASSTTLAQLNNLGVGIFDPPTVGSSNSTAFTTNAANTGLASDPSGGLFSLNNTNANFGWELRVASAATTPEPGAAAVFTLGTLSLLPMLRRRRAARK